MAGLTVFIVVAGIWSAHAEDDLAPALPVVSETAPAPSNSGPATPKITIELTPTWESAPDPAALGALWLNTTGLDPTVSDPGSVGPPESVEPPVMLAGPGPDGARFRRLDPSNGSWDWVTTSARSSLTWAQTTAVFSGEARDADGATVVQAAAPKVRAVDAEGHEVFRSQAGLVAWTTASRIVLRDGRRLTCLWSDGRLAWRARLPAGVTNRADATSPDAPLVFTSGSGPARVSVVDLRHGGVTTHPLRNAHPGAFSTNLGVLVEDPGTPSTITRYDSAWQPRWTVSGPLQLQDVQAGLVLVANRANETLELLDLRDGSVHWTSEPLAAPPVRATLTQTSTRVVLVSIEYAQESGEGPAVLAADPLSGALLWQVGDRVVLVVWRDYVILAESGGPVVSALGVTDGTSFATLNASTVVTPRSSALVGDTLIYLDGRSGIARGIQLSGP